VAAPALSKVRRAGEIGSSIVSSPYVRMLILRSRPTVGSQLFWSGDCQSLPVQGYHIRGRRDLAAPRNFGRLRRSVYVGDGSWSC